LALGFPREHWPEEEVSIRLGLKGKMAKDNLSLIKIKMSQ
jgi:hypothetical protein